MKSSVRSIHGIPFFIKGLLAASLLLQIIWHQQLPPPQAQIKNLPSPPSIELMRLFSLGDLIAAAKVLMLWLQGFDNQKGQFLSYQQLDYGNLQQWLECILQIDPHTEYPLLSAVHLYINVQNPDKQRQMLEFVYHQFFVDPTRRWQWLAQATVLAKHRLQDLPLALKYAKAITEHATPTMPRWAQEMQIFILEDMGEFEQAQLVIGGMLSMENKIDTNEIRFLNEKLLELEEKAKGKDSLNEVQDKSLLLKK